jgi:5-methyltetrahydropteroyltriglutamate--homocysteine methyltransferase
MSIPTEPIGSIPRPRELIEGLKVFEDGNISYKELDLLYGRAVRDTIRLDGVAIPFTDGHRRNLSRLTTGPFRYHTYASKYLAEAKKHAQKPVKQAVI